MNESKTEEVGMKHIRRTIAIVGFLIVMFSLTGCGKLNDYVSNSVKESSEQAIQNSDEYQKYTQYSSDGMLDENGLFPMPSTGATGNANDERSVKVTVASNSFLTCVYYTDEETKAPIVSSEMFLTPGESVYIANVSVNNDISNLYDFSFFRIWSYDQEGRRNNAPYKEVSNRNGLLLTIPEGFTGTGFSIEPIGNYTSRHITARAFYLDNGQERDLPNGKWEVNNNPFSGSVDINPVDSYTIIYDYSAYKDSYYFVESNPVCWYSKESNNTVIFREVSSNEQETAFEVKMHSFVTMNVKNSCLSWSANLPVIGDHGEGIISSITRGNEDLVRGNTGKDSFQIDKLRVGDTISIRVGKEYKITGVGVNVGTAVPLGSNADNGYEYTIVIPDTSKGISIEITERSSNAEGTYEGYNIANADVIINRADGTQLKIGQELPGDDEKVTLRITPHEGYYIEGFTEKSDYSFIKKNIKFSNLEKHILSILEEHPSIHFISLNLVFSDEAGSYTYKLDGKAVSGTPLLNVRIGQTLKVEFKANSGYTITHSWFGANAISNAWTWAGGTDSISESIKITAEMDGKSVDRETFGIIVEKEG